MKNVSKNKFLNCFRPVLDTDDAMLESKVVVHRSSTRRFACSSVLDKHDTKNSAAKSTFSDQNCPKLTHNSVVPQPPKRTLSKNTRARYKNRYGQNCFGSKRGYSASTETSSTTGAEKHAYVDTKIEQTKGSELSLSNSSSNSPESESKNLSKCECTSDQLEKQKKFHCLVVKLFLMSLAVTVFWGKINVIMLTSMLLCLFSLWNACCLRLKEVSTGSNTYKNSHTKRNLFRENSPFCA